jgi:hypothetical protein
MTVQELIVVLSRMDPEMRVVMPSETGPEFCEVEAAFVDLVHVVEGGVELSDERDGGCVSVVRLFRADPVRRSPVFARQDPTPLPGLLIRTEIQSP